MPAATQPAGEATGLMLSPYGLPVRTGHQQNAGTCLRQPLRRACSGASGTFPKWGNALTRKQLIAYKPMGLGRSEFRRLWRQHAPIKSMRGLWYAAYRDVRLYAARVKPDLNVREEVMRWRKCQLGLFDAHTPYRHNEELNLCRHYYVQVVAANVWLRRDAAKETAR